MSSKNASIVLSIGSKLDIISNLAFNKALCRVFSARSSSLGLFANFSLYSIASTANSKICFNILILIVLSV